MAAIFNKKKAVEDFGETFTYGWCFFKKLSHKKSRLPPKKSSHRKNAGTGFLVQKNAIGINFQAGYLMSM